MVGNSYIFEAMKCNVLVGVAEIGAFGFAKVVLEKHNQMRLLEN